MDGLKVNGTSHGGMQNLLRMTMLQCGATLSFAAVIHSDGRAALRTYPRPNPDSPWTLEAVEDIVNQTLSDQQLRGGRVLVRIRRTAHGGWSAHDQQVKVAAVALSDVDASEHPWGILCAAEPVTGDFTGRQLDQLGRLGTRMTAYLRARERVVGEESLNDFDSMVEPLAQGTSARAVAGTVPIELQTIEGSGARPEPAEAVRWTPAVMARPATVTNLSVALGPDPETGLPGLATLLGHLGRAVGLAITPRRWGTAGLPSLALMLFRLVGSHERPPNAAIVGLANSLKAHLREGDIVARVATDTFAAMIMLPPDGADSARIEQRLRAAGHTTINELTSRSGGEVEAQGWRGLHIRVSSTSAPLEGVTSSPESFLRQAAAGLEEP